MSDDILDVNNNGVAPPAEPPPLPEASADAVPAVQQQQAAAQAQLVAATPSDRDRADARQIRGMAIEAALRSCHPGSAPDMVVAAAKQFEAYLRGE